MFGVRKGSRWRDGNRGSAIHCDGEPGRWIRLRRAASGDAEASLPVRIVFLQLEKSSQAACLPSALPIAWATWRASCRIDFPATRGCVKYNALPAPTYRKCQIAADFGRARFRCARFKPPTSALRHAHKSGSQAVRVSASSLRLHVCRTVCAEVLLLNPAR